MQRRMCTPDAKGDNPGERFANALKQIVSLPKDKAEAIRHHTPKHRSPTTDHS